MLLVVASIGLDGLLGTEALQSCLPHQLDIRTGQLWVEGRSTLQLHRQRLTPRAAAYLTTSVVLPPDSEVVAPLSVRSVSGIWPGPCSMVEPCMDLTEDYESVRDLAGPSGRHCNKVPPLSGGGWSAVAQEPSPSVRTCFPGARGACDWKYHIGTT